MSGWSPASALRWLFDPEHGASGRLIPRWIFLRALGLIFYSAFFSLLPQIRGLIGPHGILPAGEYLQALAERFGHTAYWYAPTVLWFSGSAHTLTGICWAGMIASVLLVLNFWPRGMLAICLACFLSFVSAAQDFSAYQSDGMLLEAGFISLFFAPAGFRPGWGEENRPSRASLFLPVWECFRIYFESGVAKIMGGDPQWRNFTALDEYYQNGPLPTWIGWYMQHLPPWFHAVTAVMLTWIFYATLAQMVWMVKPWPRWTTPVSALEPFRIANRYGLFAVMTRGRYEIEFQGSDDGQTWLIYPFRFKPQDPSKAPGIYAPYQPRFDWNLWFASLSTWRQEPIVVRTEESLLRGDADVLLLFAGNPFPHRPPRQVRAVIWRYWFTTPAEKRSQGTWWRRQQLGLYAPTLERQADGRIAVLEWPPAMEPRE